MAVVRRTRILLGVVLLFVLFYTTRHYDALPRTSSWTTRPNTSFQSGAATATTTDKDVLSGIGLKSEDGQLIDNAHRLPLADDFLDHFRAVTRLPGLSIAETRSTCTWTEEQKVNFQYGPESDWFHNEKGMAELDERRQQWYDFVQGGMIPFSSVRGRFEGRGIVIVAGNQDTMMRVRVILRQLLKLGSNIGVEVTYWDDELDAATRAELQKMYPRLYFNDLSDPNSILKILKNGIYVNYQLKTAAVVNSRWAEPLLLDSDNIPVVDPESLYDTDEYREYGSIFWPDIARTRPQNPMWALTNTPCAMDEYEQESGQLLVDKRRFFYHLQLAAWFNNNQSDYYNQFILGDKDTFRFAWHALKTRYGKPRRWVTSVGTSNYVAKDDEWYYCGHSFGQHHPNGSLAFLHGGLLKTVDPEIMSWNRRQRGGFFRHYKRAAEDGDPRYTSRVTIKFDGAAYKARKLPEFHGASCTDMYDVEARPLDDLIPGFEARFEEIGGYWMLEEWEAANGAKLRELEAAGPADLAAPPSSPPPSAPEAEGAAEAAAEARGEQGTTAGTDDGKVDYGY